MSAALTTRLGWPEPQLQDVIDALCGAGLARQAEGRVGPASRPAEHFADEVARFRPVTVIARQAYAANERGLVADERGGGWPHTP